MRGEVLAPFERRRQFGDGGLSGGDSGGGRRMQQPVLQRIGARDGCGRTEPLQQRGAAEEIEIQRVRMMPDCGGRLAGGRQAVPGPADSCQRELVDRMERVVPVDTLLDACVPHHEYAEGEDERQPGGEHDRRKRLARENGIRETGGAGDERRQPPPRNALRQAPLHGGAPGVRGGPFLVVRDHPHAFRASMLSRQ